MIKPSVSETKWSSLLARIRALILYISIWIFDSGPEKLPGLSRKRAPALHQGLLTVKFCFCKGIHRRDCTPTKTWHAGFYWHTGDRYRLCNILSGRCALPMELTGLYRRSFPGPSRYIFVLYARDSVMVTKEEKTKRSIRVFRLVTGRWRRYWRGMLQRWVNYWYESPFFYKYEYRRTSDFLLPIPKIRLERTSPI